MVYARRYNTRRVSRRRGRRTLSNYRIATRTSARSQASQIYSLKKWVSRIQKRTKPEIVTIQRSASPIQTTNTSGSIGWISTGNSTVTYAAPNLGPVVDQNSGATDAAIPNNFARLQSFTLYGNLQYTVSADNTVPETWRVVIVQTLQTRSQALATADIFTAGEPGANSFNATFGPLQTGLARTCKVLSDKRYNLSNQRPNITIKTNLRYLRPYYRDTASASSGSTSSEAIPKGAIYVFFSRYSIATTAISTLNVMYKLAYTDA